MELTNTYIDSNQIPRLKISGAGEFAEILNNELAGAKNVVVKLRWMKQGDKLEVGPTPASHQVLYLLEGEAVISLDAHSQQVSKGGGVYLGPNEVARITNPGSQMLRLFHMVVPRQS